MNQRTNLPPVVGRTGAEVISLLHRDQEHPMTKFTDEELAALGALAGFAPMLRANVADQLYVLGRLAGMEENRRNDEPPDTRIEPAIAHLVQTARNFVHAYGSGSSVESKALYYAVAEVERLIG